MSVQWGRKLMRPDRCVSLRITMVGVATEILINFKISDGLPQCHPGENSQNENVVRLLLCAESSQYIWWVGSPASWEMLEVGFSKGITRHSRGTVEPAVACTFAPD